MLGYATPFFQCLAFLLLNFETEISDKTQQIKVEFSFKYHCIVLVFETAGYEMCFDSSVITEMAK